MARKEIIALYWQAVREAVLEFLQKHNETKAVLYRANTESSTLP